MPYLLKIRSYGEDTGTLSDLKEKIYSRYGRRYEDTPYGRRYAYGRCPIGRSKEKRYGRRYEDTVEDTKIQSKIPSGLNSSSPSCLTFSLVRCSPTANSLHLHCTRPEHIPG